MCVVVVTLASMLRWIWPNLECNPKTRDSQILPNKRWPVYSGNVEGVARKRNNQSTTHIDLQIELNSQPQNVWIDFSCSGDFILPMRQVETDHGILTDLGYTQVVSSIGFTHGQI